MSRSGYDDGCDGWDLIRWRGAVASAIRGHRGQALLREMAAALDAMPEKKLISGELDSCDGVCALGAVGKARKIDMSKVDPYEPEDVSNLFGIAPALAQEIAYINDERAISPEGRWKSVRDWVTEQIKT